MRCTITLIQYNTILKINTNMIEIKNVSFAYGRGAEVLESLSMQLKPGSIYGLLGENGVGKTTLLKLMAGLLFPKEGEIRVLGHEPRKREAAFLQQIYFLPDTPVVEDFSLRYYVKLNACFYPNFSQNDLDRYVRDLEVDIDRPMRKLSFGQQKKAMLAFALACNTPLLLMDEPTNGLDIPSKSRLRRLIAAAATEDKCFVISTHQVRDLEQLIDPVVIMEKQRVLLNNTMEEVSRKLWFGVAAEKPSNALYAEPAMGGHFVVLPRRDDMPDSKVQLEALFNAAITNRAYFQETFRPHAVDRAADSWGNAATSAPRFASAETAAEVARSTYDRNATAEAARHTASHEAKPKFLDRLKRFGYLLRVEMLSHYRNYVISLGVLLLLHLWRWLFFQTTLGNADISSPITALYILILLAPNLYKDLYHPIKNFTFMMRPTSRIEKFGAIWLQSVILYPALMILWHTLLLSCGNFLMYHGFFADGFSIFTEKMFMVDNVSAFGNNFWFALLILVLTIWGPQASVLWANCFFKRHKLLKLIAVYVGLFIVFSWTMLRVAAHLADFSLDVMNHTVENYIIVGIYTVVFSLCIGLYVWAYFSFTRRQL